MANDYEKVMCPVLTSGVLEKPKAGPDGVIDASQGHDAMSCKGPACAWWVKLHDETGKDTGAGNCAVTLTAVGLSQLSHVLTNPNAHKPKIHRG